MTIWRWAAAGSLMLISCSPQSTKNDNTALGDTLDSQPADRAVAVKHSCPFGLTMGQPIEELNLAKDEDSNAGDAVRLSSVPSPMSELETYAAVAYPGTGLCEIRTVSRTFDSDSYGNNVKPAMDNLAKLLSSKYGKYEKSEGCSGYSCNFFQMSLKSGSAVYAYEWSRKTGATLPANIADVSLVAMPGDYNDTFFRLDYTSSNKQACEAAREKVKAAAL